jgi:hypothetical protein
LESSSDYTHSSSVSLARGFGVGFSAPPRWRSLLVFSCGVFEANRRVYAVFLETFPGRREYVNRLALSCSPAVPHQAIRTVPFYGTRTADEATTLEKSYAACSHEEPCCGRCIGRPASKSSAQSVLSYLSVHTKYHHWREMFCCLSNGASTVELNAKGIEISKKENPRNLCSASHA